MVYGSRFRADCICTGDGGRPPYYVGVSVTTSSDVYHFVGISRSVPASRFSKHYISKQSRKESPENISNVAKYERGEGGWYKSTSTNRALRFCTSLRMRRCTLA
jgi:hypothetical protein